MAGAPVLTLVGILRAYEARLRGLPDEVDPGWLELMSVGQVQRGEGFIGRLSTVLAIPKGSIKDLEPPLHRIALLPTSLSWRVLRLRALWRRRGLVHSQIDSVQRQLRGWIGDDAFETLLQDSDEGAVDVVGLPLFVGGSECAARTLAWEGYCLFMGDGAWRSALPERLLRLGFPPDHERRLTNECSDTHARLWIEERLPRLLPEAKWIFG